MGAKFVGKPQGLTPLFVYQERRKTSSKRFGCEATHSTTLRAGSLGEADAALGGDIRRGRHRRPLGG